MRPYRAFAGGLGNTMFQFAYIYAQARKGAIPDIYLQDSGYFEEYIGELKALFGDGITPIDMVGMHVRRGKNVDVPSEPAYAENNFYTNLCETDYYEKAMEQFPDAKFLIFSDDREFCKQRFPGIQIYEGKDEIEDFNMMASCSRGNIIANSSFSWWAAFVNPSETKKVVAPADWYTDGVERTKTPNEWIKL